MTVGGYAYAATQAIRRESALGLRLALGGPGGIPTGPVWETWVERTMPLALQLGLSPSIPVTCALGLMLGLAPAALIAEVERTAALGLGLAVQTAKEVWDVPVTVSRYKAWLSGQSSIIRRGTSGSYTTKQAAVDGIWAAVQVADLLWSYDGPDANSWSQVLDGAAMMAGTKQVNPANFWHGLQQRRAFFYMDIPAWVAPTDAVEMCLAANTVTNFYVQADETERYWPAWNVAAYIGTVDPVTLTTTQCWNYGALTAYLSVPQIEHNNPQGEWTKLASYTPGARNYILLRTDETKPQTLVDLGSWTLIPGGPGYQSTIHKKVASGMPFRCRLV